MSCDTTGETLFVMELRRCAQVVATAALLAVLAVPAAQAAGWGSGTFDGRAKSNVGADRPRTAVKLVVKGNRVRVKQLVMSFNCDGGKRVPLRLESPFVAVRPGPAGGGAIIRIPARLSHGGEAFKGDVDVFLGLRQTHVMGTADSYLNGSKGGVCEDAAIFTAR